MKYKNKYTIAICPEKFEGKNDPTQYNSETDTIEVKDKFYVENDNEGWMVHEMAHADCFHNGIVDDKKPYPFNNIERIAYGAQFKWLKDTGKAKTIEDLKDPSKFPTMSLKFTNYDGEYNDILTEYWNEANGIKESTNYLINQANWYF